MKNPGTPVVAEEQLVQRLEQLVEPLVELLVGVHREVHALDDLRQQAPMPAPDVDPMGYRRL